MPSVRKEAKAALEELARLETEAATKEAVANQASRDERQAREEVAALLSQRAHLEDRNPELTDHTGAPSSEIEGNPIFEIDKALKKHDLEDLSLRTQKARKLEAVAKQRVDDEIAGSYRLIEEALLPEWEADQADAMAKLEQAAEAVDRLIGWNGRFTHLAAQAPGLHGQGVRGIEHLAALRKALANAALPSPIPNKPDGWNG